MSETLPPSISRSLSLVARTLTGNVEKGFQAIRFLGIKTANLKPDSLVNIEDGVYVVSVVINGTDKEDGLMSVGMNPTFNRDKRTYVSN